MAKAEGLRAQLFFGARQRQYQIYGTIQDLFLESHDHYEMIALLLLRKQIPGVEVHISNDVRLSDMRISSFSIDPR